MIAISIIVPCYNEENNLKRGVLQEMQSYLENCKFEYEVIICNDQSTDQSLSIIKEFTKNNPKFTVYDFPKGGKPGAIWNGIQKAKFPYLLFTDMDQSTPLREIEKLLPYIEEDCDIVIGSRGSSREGNSTIRKIGSIIFSAIRNLLLQTNIHDTQCGFKSMKSTIAKKIFPELEVIKKIQSGKGWRVTAYDVELLFIAQKNNFTIKEVPVSWKNEDTSQTKGDADARYLKESRQMTEEVWRIFINNLTGKYERF